ncbi:hypothetical protein M0812_02558 [Anaeramoeba flamelloides]|uniref:SCP domain-containing protein n=1 Tax=Anaeramoeba flamelloides TaxID=1746091 RepID=A0AAV7YM85_9EUKA|nr:hypothetical protein M0812_02558 [Anaeramoeba flamelloides]
MNIKIKILCDFYPNLKPQTITNKVKSNPKLSIERLAQQLYDLNNVQNNNTNNNNTSEEIILIEDTDEEKEGSENISEENVLENVLEKGLEKKKTKQKKNTTKKPNDELNQYRNKAKNRWKKHQSTSQQRRKEGTNPIRPKKKKFVKSKKTKETRLSNERNLEITREEKHKQWETFKKQQQNKKKNKSPKTVQRETTESINNQLLEVRKKKRNEFRTNKFKKGTKIHTMNSIGSTKNPNNSNQDDYFSRLKTFGDGKMTKELHLGQECLRLTNVFRKTQNLPPLKWNNKLCKIGMKHSEDMSKKGKIGHWGFNKRSAEWGGGKFAENVAYNYGANNPAKVCVDGWINSPGHRKNMVGNYSLCAIAVVITSDSKYYFCQLFA